MKLFGTLVLVPGLMENLFFSYCGFYIFLCNANAVLVPLDARRVTEKANFPH
jgi:hypothetical protein